MYGSIEKTPKQLCFTKGVSGRKSRYILHEYQATGPDLEGDEKSRSNTGLCAAAAAVLRHRGGCPWAYYTPQARRGVSTLRSRMPYGILIVLKNQCIFY